MEETTLLRVRDLYQVERPAHAVIPLLLALALISTPPSFATTCADALAGIRTQLRGEISKRVAKSIDDSPQGDFYFYSIRDRKQMVFKNTQVDDAVKAVIADSMPADLPDGLRKAAEAGIRANLDQQGFKQFMHETLETAAKRPAGSQMSPHISDAPEPMRSVLGTLEDDAKALGFGDSNGEVFHVINGDIKAEEFRKALGGNQILIDKFFAKNDLTGHGVYPHALQMVYFARAIDKATGQVGAGAKFINYISQNPERMRYWVLMFDIQPCKAGPSSPQWVTKYVVGAM